MWSSQLVFFLPYRRAAVGLYQIVIGESQLLDVDE